MENASKALIIAGSVLIAILIISLGLFIFKSTEGTTDQTKKLGETLEVQQLMQLILNITFYLEIKRVKYYKKEYIR